MSLFVGNKLSLLSVPPRAARFVVSRESHSIGAKTLSSPNKWRKSPTEKATTGTRTSHTFDDSCWEKLHHAAEPYSIWKKWKIHSRRNFQSTNLMSAWLPGEYSSAVPPISTRASIEPLQRYSSYASCRLILKKKKNNLVLSWIIQHMHSKRIKLPTVQVTYSSCSHSLPNVFVWHFGCTSTFIFWQKSKWSISLRRMQLSLQGSW
jgi:hypothetical protein